MSKSSILFLGLLAITMAMGKPVDPADEEISAEKLVDHPDEIMGLTTPAPEHDFDNWDDWDSWEPPADIQKWAPYYKSGMDKDGLPIYVMEYGKWNFRELTHQPGDVKKNFWKYYEQFVRRIRRDGEMNDKKGIALIIDWDEFHLDHFNSSAALKFALKTYESMLRFDDVLKYGFQINANFATEAFLNIVKPFMGTIMDKFEIHGSQKERWQPDLEEKIEKNQLAPQYGGDKDWKALPLKA